MKNKKISIVVPIHIYNFDPQGNLNQYQKLEMYMLAIEHMKILYKQCNIIICGHGINYSKEFKEYSTHVIWNKDYTGKIHADGLIDNPHTKPTETEVNAKLKELQDAWDAVNS